MENISPVFLAVSFDVLYQLFFVLAMVIFVLALYRHTVLSCAVSMIAWFSLSFLTLYSAEVEGGLGIALFCSLLGVIMLMLTFKAAFDYFETVADENNRKISEEII